MSDDPEADALAAQARGQRAQVELTETAAAFAGLRAAMLEEIVKSGIKDSAFRDKLILGVQSIDSIRKALMKAVQAGNDAQTIGAYHNMLAEQNFWLR